MRGPPCNICFVSKHVVMKQSHTDKGVMNNHQCFIIARLRCITADTMTFMVVLTLLSLASCSSSLNAPRRPSSSGTVKEGGSVDSTNLRDIEYIYNNRPTKFVEIVHRKTYARLVVDPKTGQVLVKNYPTSNVGKEGEPFITDAFGKGG